MRPNLAFGPIDSVTQYLLYLSVVALGILVPLLIQRGLKIRNERALVERTLRSLAAEVAANHKRLSVSAESLEKLTTGLASDVERYKQVRHAASRGSVENVEVPPPSESSVSFATTTRVAWDTATLAQALPLLKSSVLANYAAVYSRQQIFEDTRMFLIEISTKSNWLDAPFDVTSVGALDRRLEALLVLESAAKHVTRLASSLLQMYETAQRESGTALPSITVDRSHLQ